MKIIRLSKRWMQFDRDLQLFKHNQTSERNVIERTVYMGPGVSDIKFIQMRSVYTQPKTRKLKQVC